MSTSEKGAKLTKAYISIFFGLVLALTSGALIGYQVEVSARERAHHRIASTRISQQEPKEQPRKEKTLAHTQLGAKDNLLPKKDQAKATKSGTSEKSNPNTFSNNPINQTSDDCVPLFRLHFTYASSSLPTLDSKKVARLKKWLLAHPEAVIFVEGHADKSGDELMNLKLSKKRATVVTQSLIDAGINSAQLRPRGFGAFAPRAKALPKNRRVELAMPGYTICKEEEDK